MKQQSGGESVKVAVRVRPMNKIETSKGSYNVIECQSEKSLITINKPEGKEAKVDNKQEAKSFVFDYIYDIDSEQKTVYDQVAFPIIESVLEGYNGTIFAYGQTGCGKTHTMMGTLNHPKEYGIIPNAFHHIINFIKMNDNNSNNTSPNRNYFLRCSFLEIYNEEIRDLLIEPPSNPSSFNPNNNHRGKVELREDPKLGIYLKDLLTFEIKDYKQLEKLMITGNKNRHIGETSMNAESSRSHSIFTVYVEIVESDNNSKIKQGKLNLVDLAGSERQSKTNTTGKALDEAKKINLSLTALSNVINSLSTNKSHIPYRDSKLTRLLQDSLGGNTKTVMIAAISPSSYNYDETLSTLRYASRANNIKNIPKINEDPKDAKLRQYEEEIRSLKTLLEKVNQNNTSGNMISNGNNLTSSVDISSIKNENADKNSNDQNQSNFDEEKKLLSEKVSYLEHLLKNNNGIDSNNISKNGNTNVIKKQQITSSTNNLDKEALDFQKYREKNYQIVNSLSKLQKNNKIENDDEMNENETYDNNNSSSSNIISKLKNKVKNLQSELDDIQNEHYRDSEDLIITIKELTKESKLYLSILRIMLRDYEIRYLHELSNYDEDNEKWVVPAYSIRDKKLKLPSLNKSQMNEWINKEKKEREFVVGDEVIDRNIYSGNSNISKNRNNSINKNSKYGSFRNSVSTSTNEMKSTAFNNQNNNDEVNNESYFQDKKNMINCVGGGINTNTSISISKLTPITEEPYSNTNTKNKNRVSKSSLKEVKQNMSTYQIHNLEYNNEMNTTINNFNKNNANTTSKINKSIKNTKESNYVLPSSGNKTKAKINPTSIKNKMQAQDKNSNIAVDNKEANENSNTNANNKKLDKNSKVQNINKKDEDDYDLVFDDRDSPSYSQYGGFDNI